MKVSLEQAARLLNTGHVIGVPTETVYGLAATLSHPHAIAEIFQLKGRPSNNPLIIHLANGEGVLSFTKSLPPFFSNLAAAFWPGPLTLVVPIVEETVSERARAGLPTAAFRVPSHALARELIQKTGPLVMPSANLSGKPSATSVEHVENDFSLDFPVLDGGVCQKGVESTILYLDPSSQSWMIIRLGALAPEDFLSVLGYIPKVHEAGSIGKKEPLCPGQLYRHYSPQAKLILLEKIPPEISGVIVGFNDRFYPLNSRLFSLGESKTPDTAVHELYAVLRNLDSENIKQAYVDMDFPKEGLWLTLRERLLKAASS